MQVATEIFDYKYIDTYHNSIIGNLKSSSTFVVKATREKLMSAFKRKISFYNLKNACNTLSSVLCKINDLLAFRIPFPKIPENLIDIEAENLKCLRQAYQSEVRFLLQYYGICSNDAECSLPSRKKEYFNPPTPIYDEDLYFLYEVKEDMLSGFRFQSEIGKRIKAYRMSYLLCDLKTALENEYDATTLNRLYVLYNTIADSVAEFYKKDTAVLEYCSTIHFMDFAELSQTHLDKIRDFIDALMHREMTLLSEKTGYCYPCVQMELKFDPLPECAGKKEKVNHNYASIDDFNDFKFPKGYTNLNRARKCFELAAKMGIISKDWKGIGKNCRHTNLIVYFCEAVFCNGRNNMNELPANWIAENFGIENPSRIMSDYHRNSNGKPKWARDIDFLFKSNSVDKD
ncbi:MAG: hypothetical protein J6S84_00325 [Bacteroidales bacterium]|nr:hypothetical protein [Bacteroidales bacterium]